MIGTSIGNRYLIVALIGGGGMADVYRAEDRKLQRPVAVKVLRAEFLRDAEVVGRFENEARAAAALSHPNVVSVYDVGETPDGNRYIVMEYVEGETLKDLLQAHGPLSARQTLTLGAAVASALAAAHRKGIVHRDIKPENILITAEGEVKVTDFGIARAASGRTIVHTGAIMGSAHYFSPEQARGGYVDAKSDLYSLGAVLFECLTGRPPFEADSPLAVALKHVQEPVPSVRKLRPGVPKKVEAIVQKLMAKEPAERHRSAEAALRQMQEVLAELGGPEPLKVGGQLPTLERAKSRKSGRGRPRGLVGLLLGLALLAVAFVVYRAAIQWLDTPTVTVPSVVGRTIPTAHRLLASRHLLLRISGRRPASQAAGLIVSQDPPAGTEVKEGRLIEVVVSSGPPKIQVPGVVGEPLVAATATLEGLNLKVRTVARPSTEPEGTVLAQRPKAGAHVREGGVVTLVVSKGTTLSVNMPNLVGLPLNTAASDLENIGLYVGQTTYAPSSAPYGTVLQQSVPAGAKVRSGTGVILTLSQGPPPSGTNAGQPGEENVAIQVNGSQPTELRVMVVDALGITQAFDQTVTPGQPTPIHLTWQGEGRLEVYLGSQLVYSAPLPVHPPLLQVGGGP